MIENLPEITLQHLNQLSLQNAVKTGKVTEHMQSVMDDIFKAAEIRQGIRSAQPIQVAGMPIGAGGGNTSATQQLNELNKQDANIPSLTVPAPVQSVQPVQPYKLVPAVDDRAREAALLEQDKARAAADMLAQKNANRKLLGLPPLK